MKLTTDFDILAENVMFNDIGYIRKNITILCLVGWIGACSSPATLTKAELDSPQDSVNDNPANAYRIGVDDIVAVNVWRNPDLSIKVPVRPDGKISMPLVGDVQAGGLTPTQVATGIKSKLAAYIRDPQVAVILESLHSHEFLTRVRVTGAVRTPTSIPHRQGMTVLDAVLSAGGLNDFSAPSRARLYRMINGKTKSIDIDLDDILNKGKLEQNYILIPGDVVTVPERIF